MTIVELYDEKPINNIIGALSFNPDKIIYVGSFSAKQFENNKLPVLSKYFSVKGLSGIEIEYVNVRRDDLHGIVDTLEGIYAQNKECKFHVEVTGGEDLILVAIGILCQRYPDVQLYQISSKLRVISSFSMSKKVREKMEVTCSNSVEENLILHGASIITANGEDILPYGFHWDEDFLNDVAIMWDICCHGVYKDYDSGISYPNLWNKAIGIFTELDKKFEYRKNKNVLRVNKKFYYEVFLKEHDEELFDGYLDCFSYNDLLGYRFDDEYITFEFKNDQIRNCLTKSGLILELETFMTCMDLVSERNGSFLTGVTIDWDGDEDFNSVKYLSDPNDIESTIDTINEIDVLATCGMTPYFISCKNGKFTAEELYKLNSVSERFGKGYCKKIIVTTNLTHALGDYKNVMLQRASDMGINIIEDVDKKTDDEFHQELQKVMELPKINNFSVTV